jgi:caa(3)-type oxidase subunit IV
MENDPGKEKTISHRRTYFYVFLILAAITAFEIYLNSLAIVQEIQNGMFLSLSLAKAALVAAFFMHLRTDSKIFTYIFVIPALLFVVFAYLTIVS